MVNSVDESRKQIGWRVSRKENDRKLDEGMEEEKNKEKESNIEEWKQITNRIREGLRASWRN